MIFAIVQAHPSRRDIWPRLLEGLEGMSVEIVETDFSPPNPWKGYQECLRKLALSDTSHGLIVQDDAIVCRNFPQAVSRIVEARPDNLISLFVSGGAIGRSILKDRDRYCIVRNRFYAPVVAMIWPRVLAQEILEWIPNAPRNVKPNERSDDGMVGLWAKMQRKLVLATYPSLVQHPDDVPSVIGARGRAQRGFDRKRVAAEFIGSRDPLEFDWA